MDQARKDRVTPLFIAAENGRSESVKLLLEAGADANQARNDRVTPLYRAAHYGYEDIVERLLVAGADIYHTDHSGITVKDSSYKENKINHSGIIN